MRFKAETRITTTVLAEENFLELDVTKKLVLEKIKEVCNKAAEQKCTEIYFYYTGHGCSETGAWIVFVRDEPINNFREVEVHMNDILDAINETSYTGGVVIESDSCFSGELCYKAKEEW